MEPYRERLLLSKKVFETCGAHGTAIILARVERVRIHSAGSRSESAVFDLRVDQVLCGSSPSSLAVWSYTTGKHSLLGLGRTLAQGKACVVAIERARLGAPAPYSIVDFVSVP